MNTFKELLKYALEIDGIRVRWDKRDRDDERDMKKLERATKALSEQNRGRFWDADCTKTKDIIRKQLRKSEDLPSELDKLAVKIGGNYARTRELKSDAWKMRNTRNSIMGLLRKLDRNLSTTFNGISLRPGNMTAPIVLKHPGGPVGQSQPPSATLYLTGREGAHVTLDIVHDYFSAPGGHNHNMGRSPEFVGKLSTSQPNAKSSPGGSPALEFNLGRGGETVQVTYQVTDLCSRFRVTLTMQGFGSCNFLVEVKFGKEMVNLTDKNHPYIETYTNDGTHPDSHWGRPEMVEAIINLADAFGRELEAGRFGEVVGDQRKLWVNDLSLPWGGLFYNYASEKGEKGHKEHRWGQDLDLNHWRMNKKQQDWLHANLNEHFDNVLFHGDPLHWHCKVGIE